MMILAFIALVVCYMNAEVRDAFNALYIIKHCCKWPAEEQAANVGYHSCSRWVTWYDGVLPYMRRPADCVLALADKSANTLGGCCSCQYWRQWSCWPRCCSRGDELVENVNTLTATTFSTPTPQKYVKNPENLCFTFKHAYIFLTLFSTCIHHKIICLQSYPYEETQVHLHFCFGVA